jgi:CelD/BcsL family acetyltransferase involved in cellulose biosynthesis
VIDTLFAQKLPHMDEIGVGNVYGPGYPAFLKALAASGVDGTAPLDLRYLTCGGENVATVLGAVDQGRYFGLVLSMTEGPLKRHSPGELALRRTIEECCTMGLETFDLSQGEASYKSAWEDEPLEQFDTVIGYSVRGRAWAAATGASLWAKRRIKQSPRLMGTATALRKALLGRQTGG